MDRDKTLTGLDRWYVALERQCLEESSAIIFRPIDRSHNKRVIVAMVESIEHSQAEDAEPGDEEAWEIDRTTEQWRNLVLLTHAPMLLDAIRRVLWDLNELCDGQFNEGAENRPLWRTGIKHQKALYEQLQTEECHDLWVCLCEIQRELQDAEEEATNLDDF